MGLLWNTALSLTGSLTICAVSQATTLMSDPRGTLLVGITLLVAILCISRQMHNTDTWSNVFRLFAWTANVDLVLVLSIAGVIPHADFYLESAEPYFRTGHGFAINLWDATFHFAILLFLLQQETSFSHPWAGLVWAGSTLNSMPVFLIPVNHFISVNYLYLNLLIS